MASKILSVLLTVISIFMLSGVIFNKCVDELNYYMLPCTLASNPERVDIMPEYEDKKEASVPKLYAKASCLMDAESGRILFADNADNQMPMASTTKIMTCILALECGDFDKPVNVSSYAASMPDVQLNMNKGEQYYLADLLYSLMLESHNDTAVAIAEHVGGSVEGFAALMNDKAASLGLAQTHFVTPNGLDAEGHYTTAADLCRLAAYAVKNEKFLKIIATPSHRFSEVSGKRSFSVNNHDAFLSMYSGALGVKTGFTGKAGYCFAGAAKRDDVTLVSTVLASGWPPNKSYKWKDTKALMDYGFSNYKMYELLNGSYSSAQSNSKVQLAPISINDNGRAYGDTKRVNISFDASKRMLLKPNDKAELLIKLPASVKTPVKANDMLGKAELYINGELVNEYPVNAIEDVDAVGFKDIFEKMADIVFSFR